MQEGRPRPEGHAGGIALALDWKPDPGSGLGGHVLLRFCRGEGGGSE